MHFLMVFGAFLVDGEFSLIVLGDVLARLAGKVSAFWPSSTDFAGFPSFLSRFSLEVRYLGPWNKHFPLPCSLDLSGT